MADWDDVVPKKDTATIFKKIKSKRENKSCIDCPAKNPTWATIPHGSFLCLDCAGKHRNLGVHLSFVRSTGMDDWTWGQLRSMQVGGNPRAVAHYASKGLTTSDITEKYDSRVAKGYRDTILREAEKIHKKLGSALFDTDAGASVQGQEAEFFDTMAASSAEAKSTAAASGTKLFAVAKPTGSLTASLSGGGDGSPKLKKKLLLKKKGFGAKKPKKGGLGAVKKKKGAGSATNFDEVEAKVKAGDDEREQQTLEEAAEIAAVNKKMEKFKVKTAARDMSQMDDQKLEQAERLGMGMGRTQDSSIFSHSASAASMTVDQEQADPKSTFSSEPRGGFNDREPRGMDDGGRGGSTDDFFSSYGK